MDVAGRAVGMIAPVVAPVLHANPVPATATVERTEFPVRTALIMERSAGKVSALVVPSD